MTGSNDILDSIPTEVSDAIMNLLVVRKGEVKYQSGRQEVTWQNTNNKLMELGHTITRDQHAEVMKILLQAYQMEKSSVSTEVIKGPREFCEKFMNKWEVDIAPDESITRMTNAGRIATTVAELVRGLKIELFEFNNSIPLDPDGKPVQSPLTISELLQPAVEELVQDSRIMAIKQARDSVKYNENTTFNLEGWTAALLDCYGIESSAANICMFKHLLYSIKRGVFQYRDGELRPFQVFFSRKQGTGKTTLLKNLCSPFPTFYSENGRIRSLLEGKALKAMVRNKALVDFQELATPVHMRKGDELDMGIVAEIKAALTSTTSEDRGLYTADSVKEKVYATFVSSSNVHVYDVIQDPGGMRRFWEYQMDPKQDPRTRWKEAGELLEYLQEAYQSIDEGDPMGFFYVGCPEFDEIERIQATYAKSDTFSKYCDDVQIEVQNYPEDGFEAVQFNSFVKKFNRHQVRNGNREWRANSLLMLLGHKDLMPDRVKEGDRVVEYLYTRRISEGEN